MIVVTGGAGFIGSAVVWMLNRRGISQILVVDRLGTSEKWRNLVHLSFEDYLHKDEFLQRIEQGRVPRLDAIIHLGACSSTTERDADYLLANNFHYSRTLAEWCLARGVRFIYASSAATYGDGSLGYDDRDEFVPRLRPLNQYGYSKQLFDLWALRSGILNQIVGLKFFNVFGPNEYHKEEMTSVVFKAVQQVRDAGRVQLFKTDDPRFTDGGQMRDFVFVKDCVEVIGWLLDNRLGGLFNLGTGQARSWNDLVSAVFRALDRVPQIEYIDMPVALRGRYQNFTQAEMSRLTASGCPVKFHSLEEAVADYVTHYLQQPVPYLQVDA